MHQVLEMVNYYILNIQLQKLYIMSYIIININNTANLIMTLLLTIKSFMTQSKIN